MSIPGMPSDVSQYVLTSLSKRIEDPLDELILDASKRRGSPVYQAARMRFGPFARKQVDHLTLPGQTRQQKVQTLPDVGVAVSHRTCDWGVNSVMALAVLVRFDLYIQVELENRNYHRSHYDPTGKDLLEAIHICTRSQDNDRLVSLIANEASCFLRFVEDHAVLEASIRDRLGDFKKLAKESAIYSIAGNIRSA